MYTTLSPMKKKTALEYRNIVFNKVPLKSATYIQENQTFRSIFVTTVGISHGTLPE